MKKLLPTLFLCISFSSNSQNVDGFISQNHCLWNMSIIFEEGVLDYYDGGSALPFDINGNPIGSNWGDKIQEGNTYGLAVYGWDNLCDNVNFPTNGEEVFFAILTEDNEIVTLELSPPIYYSNNDMVTISYERISNLIPIEFNLSLGWNMVGFTGSDISNIESSMDIALGNGASTSNTFQVIKNVSGQFWSSEFSQITSFIPGEGYLMYVIGEPTSVNFQQISGYVSGIEYSLVLGWNMVAFTSNIESESNIVTSMNIALENGAGIENTFQVIKNVSGEFWSSDFSQISNFTPGEAYLMYVNGEPTSVNFQR